jgi:hypothetical protein
MTEEEKAQKDLLLTEIKADVKALIDDSQKENIKKADLDKKVEELNTKIAETLDNEGMKTLKESVDELVKATGENSAAIKAMTEEGKTKKTELPKDFRSAWKAAIMAKKDVVLTNKNDDNGERLSMKDYFTEKGEKTTPVFKAAVDMLQSNIVQSNVATVRLTELDPNRVGIPLAVYPHVMDWMPERRIMKPYMSVLVAYSYEDGAGTKTEGSAPSKSSFLFKTVEFKTFSIGTYFTLSDETLDDIEEALDEISIVAPDKIKSEVDSQVMGSSGDDSTALAGILTANKYTAFTAATYASSVAGANVIDVVAKMKLACLANKYNPDIVILNQNEIDNIAAIKNQLDDSITDRRVRFDALGNPAFVCGLRVIVNTDLSDDVAIVMDSKQALLGIRKEMEMKIGYNGTDLTEGQQTVVINVRVAFAIRDKSGVIYSSGLIADTATIDKAV